MTACSSKTMAITIALASVTFCSSSTQAGDGFPPLGAWAYGSGVSPSRTTVRSVNYPYRSVVRTRSVWATPHVSHFGGYYGWSSRYYRPSLYAHHHYLRSYYPVVRYSAPVYRVPVYVAPVFVAPPVVYARPCISVATPVLSAPIVNNVVPGINVGAGPKTLPSLAADSDRFAPDVDRSNQVVLTSGKQNDLQATVTVADTQIAAEAPTRVEYAVAKPAISLPPKILLAADAIFRAGGYPEAARAYAQMTVRYGASDLLFGRRFVAQVVAGDFEQAATVVATARMAGYTISRADLPEAKLARLNVSPELADSIVESLAARALASKADSTELEVVGTWLNLMGDVRRAELFLSRAAEMRNQPAMEAESSAAALAQTIN